MIRREDIDLFFHTHEQVENRLVNRGASPEMVKQKLSMIEKRLRELGYGPAPWKKADNPPITHFRWLALYQCAEFSRMRIADVYKYDRRNVSAAISRTAKPIGLRLRAPSKGGRPRRRPS